MTEIKLELSVAGIKQAIADLREYERTFYLKLEKLANILAHVGFDVVKVSYEQNHYKGREPTVSLVQADGGWQIVAEGQSVLFIEYGAGVYFNAGNPYPGEKPSFISEHGTYGKGYGKGNVWSFKDENGDIVFTPGNRAAAGFYYAKKAIEDELNGWIKEVFG